MLLPSCTLSTSVYVINNYSEQFLFSEERTRKPLKHASRKVEGRIQTAVPPLHWQINQQQLRLKVAQLQLHHLLKTPHQMFLVRNVAGWIQLLRL